MGNIQQPYYKNKIYYEILKEIDKNKDYKKNYMYNMQDRFKKTRVVVLSQLERAEKDGVVYSFREKVNRKNRRYFLITSKGRAFIKLYERWIKAKQEMDNIEKEYQEED